MLGRVVAGLLVISFANYPTWTSKFLNIASSCIPSKGFPYFWFCARGGIGGCVLGSNQSIVRNPCGVCRTLLSCTCHHLIAPMQILDVVSVLDYMYWNKNLDALMLFKNLHSK